MRRWLKIAVPMGIAAVLVAVLAIGFGSPSSDAADCSTRDSAKGGVSANGSTEYTIRFCSNLEANFNVHLKWGQYNPDKDLALRVTAPGENGLVFFVDNDPSAAETLTVYGPLPESAEGDWIIEVINHGSRRVNYELTFGFG